MNDLKNKGIYAHPASWKVMAEEAPDAYKDVSEVVNITHGAGISLKQHGIVLFFLYTQSQFFYSPTQIVRKIRSPIVCIAIPAEVIEIKEGNIGVVDYGDLKQEIRLDLVDVGVGEFVLVHVGFAIQKMSREEGLETRNLFREVYSAMEQKPPVTL